MHYESSGQKAYNTGATDFTGKQFYLVTLSAGVLAIATSATQGLILGALLDEGTPGQNVMVRLLSCQGTYNAVAGAAISQGALLTLNASGQVVAATQSTAGAQPTQQVVGRALEAAAGAGQIIEIMPVNFSY